MPSWSVIKRRLFRKKQVDPNFHEIIPGLKWDKGTNYDCDCGICHKRLDNFDRFPCRVCARCFHRDCLQRNALYRKRDLRVVPQSLTPIGWSCQDCSDLCRLLSRHQLDELLEMLNDAGITREVTLTQDEYTSWRHERMMMTRGRRMTERELQLEVQLFRCLDMDRTGRVDWRELLNHEACHIISQWDEDRLVGLLSVAEVTRAKNQFNWLDVKDEGLISDNSITMSYRQWHVDFQERHWVKHTAEEGETFVLNEESQKRRKIRRKTLRHAFDRVANYVRLKVRGYADIYRLDGRYSMTSFGKSGVRMDRFINFSEFLAKSAFFILSSRPNRFHALAWRPVNIALTQWAEMVRMAESGQSDTSSASGDSDTGKKFVFRGSSVDMTADVGEIADGLITPPPEILPGSVL